MAVAFLPSGVAANQVPPVPWPLASPGAVSLANRYSGHSFSVTCLVPSGRVMVPTSARSTPCSSISPVPAIDGGHAVAHEPVQLDTDGLSLSHRRSEEHTSELQSRGHLVCRLLLEKKKKH